MPFDPFDEYKFFAENTHRLSERRQSATTTYLTVNTAVLAVVALLIKESGLPGRDIVVSSIPLFLVGMVACLAWFLIIRQHKSLIRWRYEQLRAMEGKIAGSYALYSKILRASCQLCSYSCMCCTAWAASL